MNQLAVRDHLRPERAVRTDRLPRPTARALAGIEHRTMVRMANVQAESYVQTEKLKEVDHLTREAMTGQAMLNQFREVLAHGNLLEAEELRFFTDMARIGKGEIIADTIDTYCRESRGGRV